MLHLNPLSLSLAVLALSAGPLVAKPVFLSNSSDLVLDLVSDGPLLEEFNLKVVADLGHPGATTRLASYQTGKASLPPRSFAVLFRTDDVQEARHRFLVKHGEVLVATLDFRHEVRTFQHEAFATLPASTFQVPATTFQQVKGTPWGDGFRGFQAGDDTVVVGIQEKGGALPKAAVGPEVESKGAALPSGSES